MMQLWITDNKGDQLVEGKSTRERDVLPSYLHETHGPSVWRKF